MDLWYIQLWYVYTKFMMPKISSHFTIKFRLNYALNQIFVLCQILSHVNVAIVHVY